MAGSVTPEQRLKLIQEFKGDKCQCGATKKERHSLCHDCFMALPQKLQVDIYKPFLGGYEEAYSAAKNYLVNVRPSEEDE